MVIPREAVTLKNFERAEKGLPPIKEPQPIRVEPKPPKITNEIKLVQISTDQVIDFRSRRHDLRNEEGTIFCGFDVEIYLKDGDQPMAGWMLEGPYFTLKREIRTIIRQENLREF